jgi:hypothetical protein
VSSVAASALAGAVFLLRCGASADTALKRSRGMTQAPPTSGTQSIAPPRLVCDGCEASAPRASSARRGPAQLSRSACMHCARMQRNVHRLESKRADRDRHSNPRCGCATYTPVTSAAAYIETMLAPLEATTQTLRVTNTSAAPNSVPAIHVHVHAHRARAQPEPFTFAALSSFSIGLYYRCVTPAPQGGVLDCNNLLCSAATAPALIHGCPWRVEYVPARQQTQGRPVTVKPRTLQECFVVSNNDAPTCALRGQAERRARRTGSQR